MQIQVSNIESPDIYKDLFYKLIIKTGITINALNNVIINNLKESCLKKISFKDISGKIMTLDKYILQDYQQVPSLYKIMANFLLCELQAGNLEKENIYQTLPKNLIDDVLGEQLYTYDLSF